MENPNESNQINEEIELLRHNLAVSEEILHKTEDIKKYIKLQQFWGLIRTLIIIIPIIIGFMYLPPLLKDYFSQFSSLYK